MKQAGVVCGKEKVEKKSPIVEKTQCRKKEWGKIMGAIPRNRRKQSEGTSSEYIVLKKPGEEVGKRHGRFKKKRGCIPRIEGGGREKKKVFQDERTAGGKGSPTGGENGPWQDDRGAEGMGERTVLQPNPTSDAAKGKKGSRGGQKKVSLPGRYKKGKGYD